MNNPYIVILTLGLPACVLVIGAQLFMLRLVRTTRPQARMDLETLFVILNETIKTEFQKRYKLEYELKDIRVIPDFQKELSLVTHAVLESFSTNLMSELQYYYTREYIIRHVTKTIEIMILELIKEKKIKTK